MADKWARVYVVAAAALAVSVIGMIVSGEEGSFWFPTAVASAIVCVFARIKIRRDRGGR